ncbi:hypothetical protein LCGC14_2717710 [marine sediment metagenome]|uniref:Uncharacterized protein n=1 Tax=marine sediment metagenome TaxID=412755 RepID=A0A0F9BK41_9ZZZZ
MRLTLKKAILISIELWTWLAETGEEYKREWSGWIKYGEMSFDCALCEYGERKDGDNRCVHCPYYLKFGKCFNEGQPYRKWADTDTPKTRKKYASLLLAQLEELK